MLEFVFGWLLGVWMGQQLPLPSVQSQVEGWWNRSRIPAENESESTLDESAVPVFTGEIPVSA
mgnify:CR=1|jgi:hypothetical protein